MSAAPSPPMDATGDFRHDGPRGGRGSAGRRGHRGRMAPHEQRELSRWRLARGRPARDDPVTGREEASGGTIAVILPDTRDRHPGTGLFDSCAVRPPGPTRLARRTQSAPSSCGRAEQVTECRTGSPVRAVAQWSEQGTHNPWVAGSIPAGPTVSQFTGGRQPVPAHQACPRARRGSTPGPACSSWPILRSSTANASRGRSPVAEAFAAMEGRPRAGGRRRPGLDASHRLRRAERIGSSFFF